MPGLIEKKGLQRETPKLHSLRAFNPLSVIPVCLQAFLAQHDLEAQQRYFSYRAMLVVTSSKP